MALHALIDGGIHTAQYLWSNGICPKSIVFSIDELAETLAYCDSSVDTFLFVVHGCTTMSMHKVIQALSLLAKSESIKYFEVFSNIPLESKGLNLDYVFYEGDLISGREYLANTNFIYGKNPFKPIDEKNRRITKFRSSTSLDDVFVEAYTPKEISKIKDNINIVHIDICK